MVSIHAPAKGATTKATGGITPQSFIHAPAKGATKILSGFDPRAREGRDRLSQRAMFQPAAFRSTRPRRARHITKDAKGAALMFRSTRPRRARPKTTNRICHCCSFDPRAREGRDTCCRTGQCRSGCFDPRAREGRDAKQERSRVALKVSIHAPAKGATCGPGKIVTVLQVSIHAPAKGATAYGHRLHPR